MLSKRVTDRMAVVVFLAGVAVLSLSAAVCPAAGVNGFSADQVVIGPGGETVSQGKIYVKAKQMSMSMPSPSGRGTFRVIVRQDLGKQWMLNPDRKTYCEMPVDEQQMMRTMAADQNILSEQPLGTETVSGYRCQKKKIVQEMTVMGRRQKIESIVWTSPEFDMPLRSQGSDGGIMELRNIDPQPPAATHFDVPDGYRKLANMMMLFADME